MTIDLFTNNMRGGGVWRVCSTIANALAELGVDVRLTVMSEDRSVVFQALDPRIRFFCLNEKHMRNAYTSMIKHIKENNIKTIVVLGGEATLLIQLIKNINFRRLNVISRCTTNLRMVDSIASRYERLVSFLYKRSLRGATRIIAQCEDMRKDIIADFRLDEKKVVTIPNPATPSVLKMENQPGEMVPNSGEVLCICRLSEVKGISYLLDAFALLLKKKPDAILRIIGDGPLREALERQCQTLQIENNVIFEGFQTQVEQYLYNANVLALSSMFEGTPNTLIEAISFGLPVVSFNCSYGPSEIVVEGENGYLVPVKDIGKMADQLLKALGRSWNRKEIQRTAIRYSPLGVAKRYVDIVAEVEGHG